MWRTPAHKLILRMKRRRDDDASKYGRADIIGGEFYDLAKDPQEWHDLYSDSAGADSVRQAMTFQLLEHLKTVVTSG